MNRIARNFPFIVACLMLTTGLQVSGNADTVIFGQPGHVPATWASSVSDIAGSIPIQEVPDD